jgi:hypothetical protein
MTHLNTSSTSYGQKKSKESNWQFGFRSLKVGNLPNLLVCMWHATYEGYNFASNLISIEGLHTKLWALIIAGVPTLGILGPLGSPRTKCDWGVSPVVKHRVYFKGEGGGFPQVRALVSFVNLCLPMARPCTKSTQTTH